MRSVYIHSAKRAKPSLSQMSGHTSGVTLSPNHMCASSCRTVLRPTAPSYIGFVCDSSE